MFDGHVTRLEVFFKGKKSVDPKGNTGDGDCSRRGKPEEGRN